jgi:hypothetical protein
MSTIYSSTSPYYTTSQANGYLDVINFRAFPSYTDDIFYEVTKNYENRPDLLAYDLYGDQNLWWVFAVRNPGIIKDPIYDLVAGIKIYLPKQTTLTTALGS